MAVRPLHTLEICSGVGMLGEGLRVGLGYLGIETRTVCHIEREAYAAAVLAARMEEGSLDAAPIWSDLLTFDARAWRGAVDCIVAGFPCQDLSIAGRRAGLDGKRSGLFFNILDIADDCGARFLALENVAGIATATSTVVDEAAAAEITGQSYRPSGAGSRSVDDRIQEEDGAVLERAAARVLGELADRGWDSEWITLSASDVGASHGRVRWFCFAWRREVGYAGFDARSAEHGQQPQGASSGIGQPGATGDGWELGNTGLQPVELQQWPHGSEHPGAGQPVANAQSGQQAGGAAGRDRWQELGRSGPDVAHAERAERWPISVSQLGCIEGDNRGRREAHGGPGVTNEALGDTQCPRWPQAGSGHSEHAGGELKPGCCVVANTERIGCQRRGEPTHVACAGCTIESEAWQRQWCGPAADGGCEPMAHTSQPGLSQRISGGGLCDGSIESNAGPDLELHSRPLFAPGPADPSWAGIIERWPWLAPATQPGVCDLVDGLAISLDDSRAARLRCVGNGVVALQASVGFVQLLRRAGVTS